MNTPSLEDIRNCVSNIYDIFNSVYDNDEILDKLEKIRRFGYYYNAITKTFEISDLIYTGELAVNVDIKKGYIKVSYLNNQQIKDIQSYSNSAIANYAISNFKQSGVVYIEIEDHQLVSVITLSKVTK